LLKLKTKTMTIAKRNAFLEQIQSGKANKTRAEIYNIILKEHQTLQSLILYGYPEKTASGRTSELMDLGLIKSVGTKISWFKPVTDPKEQEQLINQRQADKFAKWHKKGLEMDWISKVI
jgi:hypothetical protein